jgi:GMP synthase (glutamine-hydrolysing)
MLPGKAYYNVSSQDVVAYDPTPTTGVKGDKNVQEGSIIVRGVKTADFMTAEGVQYPPEVRREITKVLTKHPKVVRVFFDETPKPPATTEFE